MNNPLKKNTEFDHQPQHIETFKDRSLLRLYALFKGKEKLDEKQQERMKIGIRRILPSKEEFFLLSWCLQTS